jgi:MFS family permease
MVPAAGPRPARARVRLLGWLSPGVMSAALLALAAGFGQFGAVAALGDVAKTFGHLTAGASVSEQAGLSGTELGLGLTVIRLASLGALPVAGIADRFGRRPTLLASCAAGLALTVAAAFSPGYWWFVAIFALGRPFLSATAGIAQVVAAELTATSDRAKAIALIAAGYSAGAGLTAIVHSLAAATLGFRGTFAMALAPMALLPLISRWLIEPDRFAMVAAAPEHSLPVLGAVAPAFRSRLAIVATLAFAVSIITGPANSFVFLFAQNVVGLSGVATATMVVGAGVLGLVGLLAGRWLADHWGRRPTAALAMVAIALCCVITYSASRITLVAGYLLGILAAAIFAPAAGALANELFPTSVRASVAGWQIAAGIIGAVTGLLVFGAAVDITNHFALAAAVTFVPPTGAALLFWRLPETKGREPEDLWPDTL